MERLGFGVERGTRVLHARARRLNFRSACGVGLSGSSCSPGRDNSKGSIIDVFNTSRVDHLELIVVDCISININDISIWLGTPKPHLRRFRLAVGVFFVETRNSLLTKSVFVTVCKYVVFVHIFVNIKIDAERNSMQNSDQISS